MTMVNRQIRLASRPVGLPRISDFQLAFALPPALAAGQVLVRAVYLSLDPHLRIRMSAADSYARTLDIGEVMAGAVVALVVESRDPGFQIGDAVEGMLGWQEYAVAEGDALRKLDPGLAPISTALGVLGTPGLTAYFGMLDICDPQPGETVVVSGAAGAVGMIAGQVARIRGCRVVGVAGSDAKVSWLIDELGFDGAFNYRTVEDREAKLDQLCPAGIDVYFDNVGGSMTDAIVQRINPRARIALCGQLSQYNLETPEVGPRWLDRLTARQAKMQGFLVSTYSARFPEGLERLLGWLKQGLLEYREDLAQGIEAAPRAFIGMLQGKNQGKQLVQLSQS